jgi:phenylacetate-CoA ligase
MREIEIDALSSFALKVSPMTANRDALERHQLERLNAADSGLALLRRQNAFYRSKLEGCELPLRSLDAVATLPFTLKSDLVEDQTRNPPYGTNLTYEPSDYTRIHATSGTTGRRLKCLDTPASWAWFTYCWQEIYRAMGVSSEDRVFAAFGFGPFVGFWAGFEAAQQIGALAIPAGAQSSEQRLDWLIETEATVLLSTPTYALRLVEVARDKGIDLPASSIRNALCAGEPGANIPSIRERIETGWGARCWDHAGMSEAGPWGYQCPEDQGLHVIETEFYAEVLEAGGDARVGDGETGELVLSNLGRWAQPALRYRTGDIVRLKSTPCACGSPFVRFPGGVLGRVDDMIQIRGVNVFPSAVESIVREHTSVLEFQVDIRKQREMWEMQIEVELDSSASDSVVQAAIAEALSNRLGIRSAVNVAAAGRLPRYELKARRFRIHR